MDRGSDERLRILMFWWMLELFSPQRVPALTRRATRPSDRQVIAWQSGDPLPWETLAPVSYTHLTLPTTPYV